MKKYQVFKHPDNRLEAVKTGFSFPGLIFGFFWLFWHKMWMWGGIAAFVSLIAYFILPSPAGYIYGVPYGHSFGLADLINIVIQVVLRRLYCEFFLNARESDSINLPIK